MIFVKKSGKQRAGRIQVVLPAIGVITIAMVGWLYFSAGGENKNLVGRMPEVDTTLLSGRARKMFDSCVESIRRDPRDPAAWGLMGRVCLAHHFPEPAGDCFGVASELDPGNYEWLYCQALAAEGQSEEQYRANLEAAIQLCQDSNASTLKCALAETLFDAGEFSAAESLLHEVLANEPDAPRANMLLARIYLSANEVQKSKSCADRVIVREPERQEALRLLSQLYSRLGDSARANQFAVRANQPGSYDRAWQDEIRQKIFDLRKDVNKLVNDALQLPPQQIEERIRILTDAVKEEPQEPNWHGFLGQSLLQVRQFAAAEKVLKNGVRLHPQSSVLHYTLGLVYLNQAKNVEAIQELEKAVSIKPDYDVAFLNLGIAYRENKQLSLSLTALQKSIDILPGNLKSHLNQAFTLELAGDEPRAIEAYRECLKLDPQSAEVLFLLGKILARNEKTRPEARQLLQQAIDREPRLEEARQLLESLGSPCG